MDYFIKIPKGVDISIDGYTICFNGKFGKEFLKTIPFKVIILEDKLKFSFSDLIHCVYAQTFIVLVQQKIRGVLIGFKSYLKLVGVGYRWQVVDNKLELKLGFSHPILLDIPSKLVVKCKKLTMMLKSTDKQKLNEFVSVLQHLKYPDPYKGKGILVKNQKVLKKQGKKV